MSRRAIQLGAMAWGNAALAAVLAGCSRMQHQQTMLHPAGPMSQRIETLWWYIFGLSLVAFVLVIASISAAAARRTAQQLLPPDLHPEPLAEQRRLRLVIGLVAFTVVMLFSILG